MPRYYAPGERKGNRTYVVRGYVSGRQREITTNARDKRGAKREWEAFATTVQERSEPGAGTPVTFAEVADIYLKARRPGPNHERYVENLKGELGRMRIADIRPMDIAAAANNLHPKASNETKNRHAYTPAAAVLHFAAENGLRDYLVVRKLKEREPEMRRPARGQPALLLANTEGELRVVLTVLFYQGWRIGEALSLTWANVDLARRVLRVNVTKGGVWKELQMHDAVFEALAGMAGDRQGRVFTFCSRWAVYRALKPVRRRLGIDFTPHMARHDFGGGLREAGATARDLMDVGTWTSEKSVARYQSAPVEHAKNILSRRTLDAKQGEDRGRGRKKA